MSLASDLMGLGVSPAQAARTASAGVGPVAATAAANATATGATKVGGYQYITFWTTASTTNSCVMPTPGGDTGPLIGDDFVLHTNTATTLNVFMPTGVTLNVGGAQFSGANAYSVAQYKTLTCWVQSSVQYFGLSA